MTIKTGRIFAGIGGWTYEPWRGSFYPDDLPATKMLSFYAQALGTVAAERVDQQANLDALPGFRAEQLDKAPLDLPRSPYEGFQVHSVARGCNVLLHGRKQRAVLEYADTIAFVHSAAGETGERLQALLQRLQLVELQLQIRCAPPVREQEAQHCDCCAGEHPTDG